MLFNAFKVRALSFRIQSINQRIILVQTDNNKVHELMIMLRSLQPLKPIVVTINMSIRSLFKI